MKCWLLFLALGAFAIFHPVDAEISTVARKFSHDVIEEYKGIGLGMTSDYKDKVKARFAEIIDELSKAVESFSSHIEKCSSPSSSFCGFVGHLRKIGTDASLDFEDLLNRMDGIIEESTAKAQENFKNVTLEFTEKIYQNRITYKKKMGCYFTQFRKQAEKFKDHFTQFAQGEYNAAVDGYRAQFESDIDDIARKVSEGREKCLSKAYVDECLDKFARDSKKLPKTFEALLADILKSTNDAAHNDGPTVAQIEQLFTENDDKVEAALLVCEEKYRNLETTPSTVVGSK